MANPRDQLVNDPNQPSFLDYPPEIKNMIINSGDNYTSLLYTARLSKTCPTLYHFFKAQSTGKSELLLMHVLYGNKIEVLKAAALSPELFFIKTTMQDCAIDLEGNRRTIKNWSPYQAMFGTGDIDMLYAVKPSLDTYLQKLPHGNELATQQVREKFPENFNYPPCTDKFNQKINELAIAVTNDSQLRTNWQNPTPQTLKLLQQFRKFLKPDVIKTGYHFNMSNIIKAHKIYDHYWTPWCAHQLVFWSICVIGFQQRLMTAPYLQLACMGLDDHINKKQILKRSYNLKEYRTDQVIRLIPLDKENSSWRLGQHFFVNSYLGYASAEELGRLFHDNNLWKTIIERSPQKLQNFMLNPETQTRQCIIL